MAPAVTSAPTSKSMTGAVSAGLGKAATVGALSGHRPGPARPRRSPLALRRTTRRYSTRARMCWSSASARHAHDRPGPAVPTNPGPPDASVRIGRASPRTAARLPTGWWLPRSHEPQAPRMRTPASAWTGQSIRGSNHAVRRRRPTPMSTTSATTTSVGSAACWRDRNAGWRCIASRRRRARCCAAAQAEVAAEDGLVSSKPPVTIASHLPSTPGPIAHVCQLTMTYRAWRHWGCSREVAVRTSHSRCQALAPPPAAGGSYPTQSCSG